MKTTACVVMVALLPLGMLWEGWVVCRLWEWFVYSYSGAPVPSLPQAIGGILLFRCVRGMGDSQVKITELHKKLVPEEATAEQLAIKEIGRLLVVPLLVLLVGHIIHLFM